MRWYVQWDGYLLHYTYLIPLGYYAFYFLKKLILYFFPLLFSPIIPPPLSSHHAVVHVHGNFFLFAQSLCPLTSPASCPSMIVSLFCLLGQFVDEIPHMSEIIWYLSFSDWLISLSIMSSRSVHTVARGKFFYFFKAKIPLCKCPIVVLSTHLWIDTWAVSISWQL